MAVSTAGSIRRRKASTPVRRIGHEDLSIALRQGLDDFLTFRGDIVFAGLIYTLIGLAAVVMTTSAPLMPFFFPVVAGVGLLGPLRRCRLLRARAAARGGRTRRPLVQLPRRAQAPFASTTWESSPGFCC